MIKKILRLPEVIEKTGIARSTIYSMMARGLFPRNVMTSERARGWHEDCIHKFIKSRKPTKQRKKKWMFMK